jgi:nucleoside-diphosphate-sugar epimerase
MRFLVTGGGGFLGAAVVRRLLARGDQVRVLGRNRYEELEAAGAEGVAGDIRDSELVRSSCRGMDGVFHIAGRAGFWGPRASFFAINVKGTANVVQGCVEGRVPRLVYTSSPSVVYDMQTLDIENGDESLPYPSRFGAPYPESKARAEKMVLDANGWESVVENPAAGESRVVRLATCALRPHLVWGEGDGNLLPRILRQARAGKLRIVGDGRNKVSMTHIENASLAHVQAMDALQDGGPLAGQAYFVNDPQPVFMWEWVNTMLRGSGIPEVKRRIPYRLGWLAGAAMEAAHALIPALGEPRLTRFVAAQMAGSHWFSCAKARRDFDYRPRNDIDALNERLLNSLQDQPQMLGREST